MVTEVTNRITSFFSANDKIDTRVQLINSGEPGLQAISSNRPIIENPNDRRVHMNKQAELRRKLQKKAA